MSVNTQQQILGTQKKMDKQEADDEKKVDKAGKAATSGVDTALDASKKANDAVLPKKDPKGSDMQQLLDELGQMVKDINNSVNGVIADGIKLGIDTGSKVTQKTMHKTQKEGVDFAAAETDYGVEQTGSKLHKAESGSGS
ncbi:hypothetical protein, partial [Legionella shakespearei]|uniref:hypothetical protein n=1 Tax=Legionella shakespearei TaxID=45075 RepID=UPI0018722307